MPIYNFTCPNCSNVTEEYMKMMSVSVVFCSECKLPMVKVPSLVHTDLKEFYKPVELLSIAMEDLDQIRDFKQRCPDVDCSDDPNSPDYGVPIARSRKAKLQALDAAGFTEMS